MSWQIRRFHWFPGRTDEKRYSPKHILVNAWTLKDKEKNLSSIKTEKKLPTMKESDWQLTSHLQHLYRQQTDKWQRLQEYKSDKSRDRKSVGKKAEVKWSKDYISRIGEKKGGEEEVKVF